MRSPGLAAIQAAEQEVEHSRRRIGEGVAKLRVAWRKNLTRPGTLAIVAGAGALAGYLVSRRAHPAPAATDGGFAAASASSAMGIAMAFVVRHALQHLPALFENLWSGRPRMASPATPGVAESQRPPA